TIGAGIEHRNGIVFEEPDIGFGSRGGLSQPWQWHGDGEQHEGAKSGCGTEKPLESSAESQHGPTSLQVRHTCPPDGGLCRRQPFLPYGFQLSAWGGQGKIPVGGGKTCGRHTSVGGVAHVERDRKNT